MRIMKIKPMLARIKNTPVSRYLPKNCNAAICATVIEPRTNEIVVARVVQIGAIESGGRFMIYPERFHPGVADIARVGRAGHAGAASLHGTAIARSEKLPLLQREVRELIEPDEQELRALVLRYVLLALGIAEPCSAAV